mmetsp:Transcript_83688/g.270586  ORF Transcript_83688/g.270586 Transcript_83688/m.270586 type:complete len:205 (+) Transcript_83688:252-866(+)
MVQGLAVQGIHECRERRWEEEQACAAGVEVVVSDAKRPCGQGKLLTDHVLAADPAETAGIHHDGVCRHLREQPVDPVNPTRRQDSVVLHDHVCVHAARIFLENLLVEEAVAQGTSDGASNRRRIRPQLRVQTCAVQYRAELARLHVLRIHSGKALVGHARSLELPLHALAARCGSVEVDVVDLREPAVLLAEEPRLREEAGICP